jgi:hypothetical protein
VFMCVLTFAALGGAFLVADDIPCIKDRLFDATEGINNYFKEHQAAKFTFMIICGLMMDTMVIAQFYRFAMWGTSFRLLICLAIFYGLRFLC